MRSPSCPSCNLKTFAKYWKFIAFIGLAICWMAAVSWVWVSDKVGCFGCQFGFSSSLAACVRSTPLIAQPIIAQNLKIMSCVATKIRLWQIDNLSLAHFATHQHDFVTPMYSDLPVSSFCDCDCRDLKLKSWQRKHVGSLFQITFAQV